MSSTAGERVLTFSVVIPNYNYDRFLPAAIESALAIDWPEVEVIVVDDGSTDGSRAVIESYGDRVHAIFQENGGQYSACNAGFAASRGDIIIFLDSDDVLDPAVAPEVARVIGPGVTKVQYQLARIDADGVPLGTVFPQLAPPPTPEQVRHWFLTTTWYPTPPSAGNAYPRDFLKQIFPLDGTVDTASDSAVLAAAPAVGDVVTVPRPLAGYRLHGSNDSDLLGSPARFSREVTRAVARHRYALNFLQGADRDQYRGALRRSPELLGFRIAAHRTGGQGLPGDTRWRLTVDAIRGGFPPGHGGLLRRAQVLLWTVAAVAVPQRMLSRVLAVRYRR